MVFASRLTSKLTRLEFKFLVYFIFTEFWALGAIWIIFLQDNGLSLTEVALIDIAFFGSIFLFEIPTGIIADKFGKKTSLILSAIIQFIGVISYGLSSDFLSFIISYIIWGLGITLMSGAKEALVYDEIKLQELARDNEDYDDHYQKIFGILIAAGSLSAALAVALGGFLGKIDLTYPIFLTAFAFLLAGVWLLQIKEHKVEIKISTRKNTLEALRTIKSKKILPIVLISLLTSGVVTSLIFWIQPFMDFKGIDLGWIGIFFSLSIVFSSLGSYFSNYITNILKSISFSILVAFVAFLFVISTWLGTGGVITSYIVIRFLANILNPYISKILNKSIASENRATSLSVIGAFSTLFVLSYELISSRVIEEISYNMYFLSSGVILIVLAIPLTIIVGKYILN